MKNSSSYKELLNDNKNHETANVHKGCLLLIVTVTDVTDVTDPCKLQNVTS